MSDKKTIRALDSIPRVTRYSKYNESLDRHFKSRSLKNLLNSLKSPSKKYEIVDIFDIQNNSKKEEINPNTEKVMKQLYKQKLREQRLKKKKQKQDDILLSDKKENNRLIYSHKNVITEPSLDPFKYSPNYDSIKPRSPCYKIALPFISPNKSKNKKNNKSFQSIDNIKKSPFSTPENNKKIKNNNENNKESNINLPNIKTEENENNLSINNKKENGLYIYCDKNNHALRFSKYSNRGDFLEIKGGNFSYVEPHDYKSEKKNKAVDFKKMQRYERFLINKEKLDLPSFWNYNPKYDLVEISSIKITFAKNRDKGLNKQYLLKKMWGNYDVKSEYCLIDNKMLK